MPAPSAELTWIQFGVGGVFTLMTMAGASIVYIRKEIRESEDRRKAEADERLKLALSLEQHRSALLAQTVKREQRESVVDSNFASIEKQLTSVVDKVEKTATLLGKVAHEVIVNGGKTTIATVVVESRDKIAHLDREIRMEQAARRVGDDKALWEGSVGPDGSLVPTKVSQQWVELTGLGRDETEEGGWAKCVAPADRDRVLRRAAESARGQQVFEEEYDCTNVHTKVTRRVRHTGRPVWDGRGELIGWVGLIVPI